MPRSCWLLVALAAVALASTGCAHCDTCDEFPLPCPSGDCGVGLAPGPVMTGPMVVAPTVTTVPIAPSVIQSQSAGTARPGTPANSNSPGGNPSSGRSPVPAPLPPSPGVQAPPFAGPSAMR